jgi:hypothetical protein
VKPSGDRGQPLSRGEFVGTFPASFRSASQQVHDDHESLMSELVELDAALNELAHPAGAELICARLRTLSHVVPEHFTREEEELLAVVAKISPELNDFASEMKRQHQSICGRLVDFRLAAENLREQSSTMARDRAAGGAKHTAQIEAALARVKEIGKALAEELTNHVALEEDQLAGFL